MHSGLFYWQSVFISEADLLGWLVLPELCLVHINNKPVKTFYLKIEKLLNLRQGRHDTTHHTHNLPILEIGKTPKQPSKYRLIHLYKRLIFDIDK